MYRKPEVFFGVKETSGISSLYRTLLYGIFSIEDFRISSPYRRSLKGLSFKEDLLKIFSLYRRPLEGLFSLEDLWKALGV